MREKVLLGMSGRRELKGILTNKYLINVHYRHNEIFI